MEVSVLICTHLCLFVLQIHSSAHVAVMKPFKTMQPGIYVVLG